MSSKLFFKTCMQIRHMLSLLEGSVQVCTICKYSGWLDHVGTRKPPAGGGGKVHWTQDTAPECVHVNSSLLN